jgi:hypothetical protein
MRQFDYVLTSSARYARGTKTRETPLHQPFYAIPAGSPLLRYGGFVAKRGAASLQKMRDRRTRPRLIHEGDNDGIDYSKLSDKQLEQLEAMFEQTGLQSLALESGESPA